MTEDLKDVPPVEQDTTARMESLLDQLEALSKENATIKAEINRKRIMDELTEAARILRIPDAVTRLDLPRYVDDFMVLDGKIVARQDQTQDVVKVLTALQKERIHWQPMSRGAGNEPLRATSNANNYSAFIDQQTKDWFDTH